MIEELYPGIFRIGVVLPGNPLRELNSYFIRGEESDLLIDTGFRRPACREALEAGLKELGSDPARRDVLVTHLHSDHSGMADLFVGPGRRIFISAADLDLLDTILEDSDPSSRHHRFVQEGDEIRVGPYTLETLVVPGHTPGNTMFYIRDRQTMFTGDHILFDITPNITHWPSMEDSLGSYLEQLERVRDIPVRLALPGHRKTGDYRARIDQILAHHSRRIDNALSIVKDHPGLCAYEIAGIMKWKIRAADWDSFPIIQKWFAVGECLSHLDYLRRRDRIRFEEEGGIRRYYAV